MKEAANDKNVTRQKLIKVKLRVRVLDKNIFYLPRQKQNEK